MTRASVVLDGDVGPLRQKLRQAAQDINAFGREGAGAMGDMLGPAQALQGRLAGIAGVITSGAFAAFVKTSISIQDEMSKAAQKAGVTTEAFSANAYAARLADVDVQTLGKSYAKLSGLLEDARSGQRDAVETFQRLKLDPANFRDADQLLLALAERFASMPDGAAKTALAIDLLGERLGPGLIPYLNQGREGIEALREEARRLGVVVDTETGKAAEQFNDTLTKSATVMQGVGMRIAQILLPGLNATVDGMASVARETGLVDFIGNALRITLETLAVLGANVGYIFHRVGIEIGAWGAQIAALMRGDWEGFKAISTAVKEDAARARATLDDFERRVLRVGEYAVGNQTREDRGFVPSTGTPFKPGAKAPSGDKEKADAERSFMQYYELQLAEEKRVAAILDQGREFSKERELSYWRFILDNATVASADRVAILRKTSALEIEIARKANADREALDRELATQAEAMALGKVDAERAAAVLAFETGRLSRAQLLQLEAQYEAQRYQIQRAGLEQRLQLLASDPTTSEVEKQRIVTRLLELDRQYEAKRQELAGKLTKEGMGLNLFDDLAASAGRALGGILTGTMKFSDAMRSILASAGQALVEEMAVKPFVKWVAMQARMLAMKLGFITQEEAMQAAGSAATVGIKSAETTAVVAANAAQAGTGAAASQAAIPLVGPGLALAAMAAVFAAVMALGGSRKSAAGGYDIPSGMNPLTQLHEEEMVLPKHLANAVRAMAAPAAEPPPPAAPVQLSGVSAGDFFIAARKDLLTVLRGAQRDRAWSPR